MTKLVGLIGYPLRHSFSPMFQQAAFDYLGLDVRYEIWETELDGLPAVVQRIRHPLSLGANVTVPYKEAVLPLVDELDELADQIGAVNTIVNRDGRLIGYNTDAGGFLRALRDDAGFEPNNKRVVLLGAGGAARAAGFSLVRAGISSLTVINRTLERAQALVSDLESSGLDIAMLPWESLPVKEALSNCDLIVNCTSLGMKHSPAEGESPLEAALIPGGVLVYDVVYNPAETPLLREAKKTGARTLGGLPMLVYQGAASFELWTGEQAPVDIMLEAAKEVI